MKVTNLHNKLVRDKIPLVLAENEIEFETEEVTDEVRFLRLLLDKLVEEADEATLALDDDLLEELADVESVIDAILKQKGWTRDQLKEFQDGKDDEKGVFDERVFLINTVEEEPEESEEVAKEKEEEEDE